VAPAATQAPTVERRSPDRAKNVVRPNFKPVNRPEAAPVATAVPRHAATAAAGAGGDDWETF
jgi:methyl-accepting chemotaxis protein